MDEEKLFTCRVKGKIARLVAPLMEIVVILIVALITLGWMVASGASIIMHDWTLMILMAAFDAMAAVVCVMVLTLPPVCSKGVRLIGGLVLLISTVYLILKTIIVNIVIIGYGSALVDVVVVIVDIVLALLYSYIAMISLCEFEKLTYNGEARANGT